MYVLYIRYADVSLIYYVPYVAYYITLVTIPYYIVLPALS